MKWAHSIRYGFHNGRVRAICSCGEASHWGTRADADAWRAAHTQIKEKKGTPARGARDA